jgi:RNA polymerase sigma-70 factor (ECF subfamily)
LGLYSFPRDNAAAFHDFAQRGRGRRPNIGAVLLYRAGERPLESSLEAVPSLLHRPLSLKAAAAMNSAGVANEAEPPTGDANSSVGASLLVRLREGQAGAWERLVRLYGQTVYAWCRGAGVSEVDAADVSQEVFAAVARRIADFRRERPGDSFRGWLWTITRNKVRDHWRHHAEQVQAAGGTTAQEVINQAPEDGPSDSEAGAEEEAGDLYRRALELIRSEFEERTWKAFLMVTVEGRLPADAASALGTTPGAVYIAKSRVLKRLREEFGDLIGEGR